MAKDQKNNQDKAMQGNPSDITMGSSASAMVANMPVDMAAMGAKACPSCQAIMIASTVVITATVPAQRKYDCPSCQARAYFIEKSSQPAANAVVTGKDTAKVS